MEKETKPSVIVFDTETSPQLGYFFGGMWETNIVKVVEYETIITISYWDSKTKKVKSLSQWDFPDWKKGVWNDKSLVKTFREIINKYDIIVGQNSDQFDIKLFNSRLAFHGFESLPVTKTFDTKKIAKSKLKLPSYSLEIMANFFGLEGKYHHSGLDMWFKCKDGDKKAQKEMTHYCNIDVVKTKDVFYKLLPFVKFDTSYSKVDGHNINCSNPLCLSKHLIKSKRRMVQNGFKQQYQCKDCGSYTTGAQIFKLNEK